MLYLCDIEHMFNMCLLKSRIRCLIYVYCLYVPEYPAWAFARVLRKVLRKVPGKVLGKRSPVVVVSGGRVISRTRIHQLRSVNPGDRADRVRRLCPDAVIRIRDVQLERACWESVLRDVNAITPFIEGNDPPFVYFAECSFSEARALSIRLSAQVGFGAHRSIAQLAALRSAEGHVLQVRARRLAPFLRRFDTSRLAELGFSEDVLEQLRLFGYHTLCDVCRLNDRQLEAQFDQEGKRLHKMLHPKKAERIPLYVSPPVIERWYAYDDPVVAEPGTLKPVLEKLIDQAVEGLGAYRCQRIRLAIHAERAQKPRWAERILSVSRGAPDTLFRLTVPLMEELIEPGVEVERMGIQLGSLRKPNMRQAALFDERPAALGVVRNIHRRYPGFIRRAVLEEHALFEEDEVTLERFADSEKD